MKIIKVVCAIIVENNLVLSVQRGYGEFRGYWEFPGGKIEDGESPSNALIREIKEELDADISVGDLLVNIKYDYPNFSLDMDAYLTTLLSEDISLEEHEDCRWLSVDNLDCVKWLPADELILQKLKNLLTGEQLIHIV